ncbi:hypothetical protein K0M31_014584 [Melipona bicolor]|uniref:Calx-beta domain-containing protein n=1 Tax=Melipona bicolor TaxID=60889 RepID=A0AA40KUF4_9HYME|nr:hypothetical protein K0M31_014584 [Melipona bicolor]
MQRPRKEFNGLEKVARAFSSRDGRKFFWYRDTGREISSAYLNASGFFSGGKFLCHRLSGETSPNEYTLLGTATRDQKVIQLSIIEEDSYEKDALFYVELGEPQLQGGECYIYFA